MVIEKEVAGEAARELLRATHWCPPHPVDLEQTTDDIPWVQVLKERAAEAWSESIREMPGGRRGSQTIGYSRPWFPRLRGFFNVLTNLIS